MLFSNSKRKLSKREISKRTTRIQLALIIAPLILLLASTGCLRGRPSEKPPIHIVLDMDNQEKYKAQGQTVTGEPTMRTPPGGTVARGELQENTVYYAGKTENGEFIKLSPVEYTLATIERGQQRFNIYCAPCHGRVGDGQGIVVKRGLVPPPSFHIDRLRDIEDGHIFDVITNGLRNMPSYRHAIPVADRWAIIAYFRALQRSQNAGIDDIPESIQEDIK